ncbi:hypothetical protein V9K97_17770 [Variovorax sp. CCNWLW186]|uniref:hypothetical protein n=1 Tax=Variovorax sp. CCNWLW186 TaxID=3127473 RepID=UPI003078215A
MNTNHEHTEERTRKEARYAVEHHLPGGRIEVASARSRRKLLIEPGSAVSLQGALLHLVGLPRAMNATINRMFCGRWDPATRTWTVPKSKGVALRAYLAEHF